MAHEKRTWTISYDFWLCFIPIIGFLTWMIWPFNGCCSQPRSPDYVRKGHLQQISTALEAFYTDRGYYPYLTGGLAGSGDTIYRNSAIKDGACISDGSGASADWLLDLVKGRKVALDPDPQNVVAACGWKGAYGYWPMSVNGKPNQAYALIANVQNPQMANSVRGRSMTPGKLPADFSGTTAPGGIFETVPWESIARAGTGAGTDLDAVYVIVVQGDPAPPIRIQFK